MQDVEDKDSHKKHITYTGSGSDVAAPLTALLTAGQNETNGNPYYQSLGNFVQERIWGNVMR